tara:strand:+ start:481 stop:2181 length:1701 start_codon:yes stop_codon:yes gene_type:complete
MGILDKGKEVASFIGSAIFDPGGTSRGYEASKKLIDSGELYLNELRDQITESTAFWINHRKLLGTDFMEHETREALLARLMDRKRKTYEKTDYSYDPVAHKKELMDSGEFERAYNIYMDKYKKAEKYRLPSGLAYESPEFVENTVAKYSNSTKQAFNKLAREVYNSYGIDKDLFALLGFGKGRDLSLIEIEGPEPDVSSDDYSFLMQEKDSPTKTALINKLTKEIEAGLVGYGKIDTEELALAMQKLESLYTPPRKRKSPGELDNNPRINGLVNDMIEGEFTPSVKEINWGPEENTIDFTAWVNDLDDLSKSAFYKDLQQYASWITNVYDDAKLVPEGGTKHDEELLIVTLDYMIENDKFKSEDTWVSKTLDHVDFIPGLDDIGINSGYTPFTDNEKRKFFDNLPEYLNNLSGISLTDEQLEAVGNSIATIRANAKEEEKTGPKDKGQETDSPIDMVKKMVQGTETSPPLTFNSEKKKRQQLLELTIHWEKEGRDQEEIVEALFMLERIPVAEEDPKELPTDPIRAGESDYAKKRRLEREFAKSLRIEKRESSKTGGTVSLLDRDK